MRKDNVDKLLEEMKHHLEMHEFYLDKQQPEEYWFHAGEIHNIFYKYADNEWLNKIFRQVQGQYDMMTAEYIKLQSNKVQGVKEHRTIYEAVKKRDISLTCELIEAHYLNGIGRIFNENI